MFMSNELNKVLIRITALAALGTLIEWYDFL